MRNSKRSIGSLSLSPVSQRRLLIIYNPTAGGCRGRRLEAVLAALRGFGCAITLQRITAARRRHGSPSGTLGQWRVVGAGF